MQLCPKLLVSNAGSSHFCLIMSLESEQTTIPPLYVGLLVSNHTLLPPPPPTPLSPATPSLSSDTHTQTTLSPHPLFMSALRAIIIMPCINNASQYINNASLQHGRVGGEGGGGDGGGGYRRSFPGSAHHIITALSPLVQSFALFSTPIKGLLASSTQREVCVLGA